MDILLFRVWLLIFDCSFSTFPLLLALDGKSRSVIISWMGPYSCRILEMLLEDVEISAPFTGKDLMTPCTRRV